MVSRRTVLVSGGAAAVVAGAGLGAYATYPGQAAAREPWRRAGESLGDIRLDALAYAILAPNPHNRQPWQFTLRGTDHIDVTCDLDRRLPHTDPFDRQITIGFGCMLELLRMAAAEKDYRADITPFPDGPPTQRLDGRRVASVRMIRDETVPRDPLFAHILERRSLKEPYDVTRPVSRQTIDRVTAAALDTLKGGGTVDPSRTEQLIDIAWRGWMIEYETAATRRESIDLMRIGNRAVTENPDGIDMGGTMMGLFRMAGIISPDALDTPGSTAYQTGIDLYKDIITSAQGFVWLVAAQNDRISQIHAGRSWVRMNLAAQKQGLGIHPLSQVLQEFPEMRSLYTQIHDELAKAGGTVQMLGRVGYSAFPAPSPRWPLEAKLITQPPA